MDGGTILKNVAILATLWMTLLPNVVLSQCGGRLTRGLGDFKSPNFPDNYQNNAECNWEIIVPEGKKVDLKFLSFDLEPHSNCNYDKVEIYDGADVNARKIGPFCGTDNPADFTSSGNKLYVKFKTDGSQTYKGFEARFDTHNSQCGGRLTGDYGEFKSPNFPENYQDNAECTWEITIPEGKKVDLKFFSFHLEAHSNCNYDKVEIYDGADVNARKFGPFCGTDSPADLTSSGNKLYVKFKTDGSHTYKGFAAGFNTHSPCGGRLTGDSGEFQSPNWPFDYPNNTECIWEITVPEGKHVNLDFKRFSLEGYKRDGCEKDYVEIYDGARNYGRFCEPFDEIYSTGNKLYVKLKTDDSKTESWNHGFEARFESMEFLVGSVVMIVTGKDDETNKSKNAEIFDMASGMLLKCPKIQPFPFDRLYGASGGIVDGSPMICGGYSPHTDSLTTCHSLNQNGHWIEDQTSTVNPGRVLSGSVVMQNQLLMVGGWTPGIRHDYQSTWLNSIVALKPNTRPTTLAMQLPLGYLKKSCVVPWNDETFFVIGGESSEKNRERRTYFVNIENERVTPGPALHRSRRDHGCSEIMVQGQPYIIVGGGYKTEMLKKEMGQSWTEVADHPYISESTMVASPAKDIVYSFGGYNYDATDIYKFTCPDDQIEHCQWEMTVRKSRRILLKNPRESSVAMTIPYDIARNLCQDFEPIDR